MGEKILGGGVDGATGRYALPPVTDLEVAERAPEAPPFEPAELREYRWWVERHGLDDPRRAPVTELDPKDLADTGWGVIFSPAVSPEMRRALEPLLEWRRSQAGRLYKELVYQPGQSKQDFLASHKAFPGRADPHYVPYYLLIVGDPETIPFSFQYELDVQYAVGRIWFDQPKDYARYAESVVGAETSPPARSRQLVFFGVENSQDTATQLLSHELISPLAKKLMEKQDWEVRLVRGPEATKGALARLLGGNEAPALLFTASHGMSFPAGHPLQLSHQGALLCSDWPGPEWEGLIPEGFYFSADDVGKDADFHLHGLIAFLQADFSGGTPRCDDFLESLIFKEPILRAPRSFMARLPQRLLSHPRGALAVVAPTNRMWTTSFGRTGESRIQVFENALLRLLDGYPLGFAMEFFNQRFAELAVELASLWEDRVSRLEGTRERFGRLWRATHDARSIAVFGDPAVRLTRDEELST